MITLTPHHTNADSDADIADITDALADALSPALAKEDQNVTTPTPTPTSRTSPTPSPTRCRRPGGGG